MRYLFGAAVVLLMMFSGLSDVTAEDREEDYGVGYLENLGEGEYMSDSGEITEMEDIGGGDKMSTDGDILQSYGSEDGDLATSSGGLLQVDE